MATCRRTWVFVVGLLLAVTGLAAGTTTRAVALTYDAPPIARFDARAFGGAEASSTLPSDVREGSASPSVEGRGTSTTGAASTYVYDAPSTIRAHDHAFGTSAASSTRISDAPEVTASRSVEACGTSTTPAARSNATKLDPGSIRFSQSSVNDVGEVASSMRSNGWVGEPVDVVRNLMEA